MIAVIADDFTGAAEIGGLGLLHGLKTAIVTEVVKIDDLDLLIIATEMRSLSRKEAAHESERITGELLKLNPDFIYKKIDSVLRGNVISEIEGQLKVTGLKSALIIPANPNLNRIIIDGIYYIDGKPLIESTFSEDKSYTNKSSNVLEILSKRGKLPLTSVSPIGKINETGLLIGNTVDMTDLDKWSERISDDMMPCGAAGFFKAILEKNYQIQDKQHVNFEIEKGNALFICGSNFPVSKQLVLEAKENGHFVSTMPDEMYYGKELNPSLIKNWANEIILGFQSNKNVIVSVLQQKTENSIEGSKIKKILGELIKIIFETISIKELYIEGGATAFAIIKQLDINNFSPINSFAPGVVKMEIKNKKGQYLTVKPGSYNWPESIWKFN